MQCVMISVSSWLGRTPPGGDSSAASRSSAASAAVTTAGSNAPAPALGCGVWELYHYDDHHYDIVCGFGFVVKGQGLRVGQLRFVTTAGSNACAPDLCFVVWGSDEECAGGEQLGQIRSRPGLARSNCERAARKGHCRRRWEKCALSWLRVWRSGFRISILIFDTPVEVYIREARTPPCLLEQQRWRKRERGVGVTVQGLAL